MTAAIDNRSAPSSPRKLTTFFFFLVTFVSTIFLICGRHLLRTPSPPASISSASIKQKKEIRNNERRIIPPLEDLINKKGHIIGDVSWMLDFAIIGFPKSGTSFLKSYLNQTDETFVYHREFCIKKPSDLTRFVQEYHELHVHFQQLQPDKTIRFGVKCPGVLYRSYDLDIYQTYFPNTKFIIGVRHPVHWFESFYNYQMGRNVSLPASTISLIGRCENHRKVCTDRARFHAALARLRKTPLVEQREVDLLFGTRYESNNYYYRNSSSHSRQRLLKSKHNHQDPFPNQLLLYEVRQLHQNDTTPKELTQTLQNYLNLNQELPPIQSYRNMKPRAINICDDEHVTVRSLLVEHGTDAAVWIREYLMKNPTVEIASPESFDRLLESWSADPCMIAS